MGNEDFPCFYLSQASTISSVHERVCEWSQALISNCLTVQFMSPITLLLIPCPPGHLDLITKDLNLCLIIVWLTDLSHNEHISDHMLVGTSSAYSHKGYKVCDKGILAIWEIIFLCVTGEETQDPRKEGQLHIKVARIASSPPKSYSPCSLLNRCPACPSQGWTPWYMASDWAIAWKIFLKSNLVASSEPPGLQNAFSMVPLSHDELNTLH